MKNTRATNSAAAGETIPHRTGGRVRVGLGRTARALAAGALVVPGLILGAMPAQAASACTITPQTPEYSHTNSKGVKVINYKISVYCAKERYLNIEQQRWEEDDWPNDDDYIGRTYWQNEHFVAGESYVYNNKRTLVDGEVGNEEVYQKVAFQEGLSDIWSPWSGWMKSGVLDISN